ncbi:MAG TPA: AraC family transcriptional regulator [Prolixibacteraceae bacterium]|nr:AraC family transcriptional regulator [Prolixibacteraceae bacterium]
MKPIFENIQPNPGNSFFMSKTTPGCCEPFWHIHPEYEIVYIKNGSAERHIGSHFSKYENGDLMMIGSNIPHSNLGNNDFPDNVEVVIQMSKDFVEKKLLGFPEFQKIGELMKRSMHGISFHPKVKDSLSVSVESLSDLPAFERLVALIRLLHELALAREYTLLNAESVALTIESTDYNRINLINQFVSENYSRQIMLSEVSKLTGLTESSFSRFFKKVTGKTFITFLNEYRVQKACVLLSDKSRNIAEVMFLSGFNEPAHFTRIFRKYTSYTPKEYQGKLRF